MFRAAAASAAPELNVAAFDVPRTVSSRHLFRSDHVAFWEAGLSALMLTDTAEFRNPNYHTPTDTAETLVPEFWRNVVRATLSAIGTLAMSGVAQIFVDDKGRDVSVIVPSANTGLTPEDARVSMV